MGVLATPEQIAKHRRMPDHQLDALSLVCMGKANHASARSLRPLAKKGLIVKVKRTLPGEPHKGPMYAMPFHYETWDTAADWVHHLWCALCAEREDA